MNGKVIAGLLIAGFILYFAARPRPEEHEPPAATTPATDPAPEPQSYPDPAPAEPPVKSFGGYVCTVDCGGHDAGYNWAEEKGIDDEDDCDTAGENSNSPSFAEGCKAYVKGNSTGEDDGQDQDRDADQDNEDTEPADQGFLRVFTFATYG